MERVLIVGNGYAGLSAARVLSSEKGFEVTVVSAEACPAYCPHLLPEIVAGTRTEKDVFLPAERGYVEMGVRFLPGAGVEKLSARSRKALLSTGETVPFDKALIASGARPRIPKSFEAVLSRCGNVVALKRLSDALALRKLLDRGAGRVVLAGAGRVGMLFAEALKDRCASVTVVEVGPRILATMLQRDVADRLSPVLAQRPRLEIRTGAGIVSFGIEGGNVTEARLSDGSTLPCDVLAIATGAVPNTAFAEGNFAAEEGLPVDSRMETREPGIYAAGDAVLFETVTGKRDVGQLAGNARKQGEIAARNIAGRPAACPPMFTGNVVKLDPFIAARIGEIEGTDQADFSVDRSFARATLEGSTVTGFQLVGDPEGLRGLVPAVLKKFRPGDIADLLRGRTDLGLAPLLLSRGRAWA